MIEPAVRRPEPIPYFEIASRLWPPVSSPANATTAVARRTPANMANTYVWLPVALRTVGTARGARMPPTRATEEAAQDHQPVMEPAQRQRIEPFLDRHPLL